jgi:hypothetical protein
MSEGQERVVLMDLQGRLMVGSNLEVGAVAQSSASGAINHVSVRPDSPGPGSSSYLITTVNGQYAALLMARSGGTCASMKWRRIDGDEMAGSVTA